MFKTTWYIMDKDESFIKALGLITSRYALLEELIIGSINVMVGGECAGILTAGLPFSRLLTMLGALYKQKYNETGDEDYPDILKSLLTQAENAEEERNKIIHSIWQKTPFTDKTIRTKRNISRKKGLKIDTEIVSAQELNDVADTVQNAVESALGFYYDILSRYTTMLIFPWDRAFVDTKPEFAWAQVEGAISYDIVISEKSDFNENSLFKHGDDSLKDTKFICDILLHQKTIYYWKVRPIIATETGFWSEVRSFTVK